MGEIFLARLEGAAGFEKLFVIKRILPHLADDERFRAMLIAEARVASMMAHANICQVNELGETDGQLYIVMEYLEGVTLLPLLRKLSKSGGALEFGFIAGVITQATDALHYAHELRERGGDGLGIVHRDVTPTNLFLTEAGVVKILDFGIAKVKDISTNTQAGTVKGKYAYMAPEQLRGQAAVDRRADVFALGIVVYEMLALRRLFQRKTDYLTFRAVLEQPIIDIRRYRQNCPDALAAALGRALDRDPAARFDTARQFGSAVADAVAGIQRPWTQGEIGDFVRANFAAEIAQRSAQIESAVRAGAPRATMPLIAQGDEDTTEVDGDSLEFGPASSEVSETPVDVRHLHAPSAEQVAVDEPIPAPPSPEPLRARPPAAPDPVPAPAPIMMVHRRSLVWPLVAFAMVAVAGGALFLVWQQTQNPAPVSLVITNEAGSRVESGGSNVLVVGPDEPEPLAVGSAAPAAAGSAGSAAGSSAEARRDPPKPAAERRRPPSDPYRDVVRAKQVDANRCASAHGNPPPGTQVQILINRDGVPRSVAIDPASVDATPLGTCIKAVFRGAAFPRGRDYKLSVRLVPPA